MKSEDAKEGPQTFAEIRHVSQHNQRAAVIEVIRVGCSFNVAIETRDNCGAGGDVVAGVDIAGIVDKRVAVNCLVVH